MECKFSDSIVIIPNGNVCQCKLKLKHNEDYSNCKNNNMKPVSPNTIYPAISTSCNVGENECTFCDDKLFKKKFKFNKEKFIQSIVNNIKDEKTKIIFCLFESLVEVDNLIEVLKDYRISNNDIIIKTNGKVFNEELCILSNKLNIKMIINYNICNKDILRKYSNILINLKVEITLFKTDGKIDIWDEFNIPLRFRFVNTLTSKEKLDILLYNNYLLSHNSKIVRNSFKEITRQYFNSEIKEM